MTGYKEGIENRNALNIAHIHRIIIYLFISNSIRLCMQRERIFNVGLNVAGKLANSQLPSSQLHATGASVTSR